MKSRRIHLGPLYVAALVFIVVLIPLAQLVAHQPWTIMHRQSSAMALRIEKMSQ